MKFPRGVRWIPWAAVVSVVAATLLANLPARAGVPWLGKPPKGGLTNSEVSPPPPPPVPPTNSSTPPPPPPPPPPSPPPNSPPPPPNSPPPPPHNTPEPATLVSALLGAGVCGLLALRRRNRKGEQKGD
jgi:PEP-CTERM motif